MEWQLGLQWNFYAFALPALVGAIVILFVPRRRPTELDIAAPISEPDVKSSQLSNHL